MEWAEIVYPRKINNVFPGRKIAATGLAKRQSHVGVALVATVGHHQPAGYSAVDAGVAVGGTGVAIARQVSASMAT